MSNIRAAITGIAGYLPEDKITNADLESMVDTNDEWIVSRTGIKERRILKDKTKASSFMGAEAAKKVLEKTNTNPEDIDFVLCCTATPDYLFPSTGVLIAKKIGAKNAAAFDLMAACSGFLYAISTASQFIETGKYKKILVVGADKMSSIVDYGDRSTCILFGDAAGAALLEPNEEGLGVQDFVMECDGAGEEHLIQIAGGSLNPANKETLDAKQHYIYQDGRSVFKVAVTKMAETAEKMMKRNNLSSDDIDYFISHQANKRIIDATAKKMELPEEKVLSNIYHYGNTTCATIPLVMWDYEEKLKKGDTVILAAFGGGFTWGGMYLKWAY